MWNLEEVGRAFLEEGFAVWEGPENEGRAAYLEFKEHPRAHRNIEQIVRRAADEFLLVARARNDWATRKWIEEHPELGLVEVKNH